jgi:hypothetical protein
MDPDSWHPAASENGAAAEVEETVKKRRKMSVESLKMPVKIFLEGLPCRQDILLFCVTGLYGRNDMTIWQPRLNLK